MARRRRRRRSSSKPSAAGRPSRFHRSGSGPGGISLRSADQPAAAVRTATADSVCPSTSHIALTVWSALIASALRFPEASNSFASFGWEQFCDFAQRAVRGEPPAAYPVVIFQPPDDHPCATGLDGELGRHDAVSPDDARNLLQSRRVSRRGAAGASARSGRMGRSRSRSRSRRHCRRLRGGNRTETERLRPERSNRPLPQPATRTSRAPFRRPQTRLHAGETPPRCPLSSRPPRAIARTSLALGMESQGVRKDQTPAATGALSAGTGRPCRL